jgi:DNA-binding IclR family transcriptional regulator
VFRIVEPFCILKQDSQSERVEAMVQSVERAFAILDVVSDRPAGVTAIAARLGLPKSTVSRFLSTLERVGAVERVGPSWRVGEAVAALASSMPAERSLPVLARPELDGLVRLLGEDAGLALADGYDVHYVDQVESDNPVQVRDWTGTRAPMHTVPSGLVFLAEWPVDAVAAYVERGLVRLTPQTIVEPRRLRRRLREVREQGYAWGREEFAVGINSVAVPIRDGRDRVVAALHVHGPAYRFPPEGGEVAVVRALAAAAGAVGGQLRPLAA